MSPLGHASNRALCTRFLATQVLDSAKEKPLVHKKWRPLLLRLLLNKTVRGSSRTTRKPKPPRRPEHCFLEREVVVGFRRTFDGFCTSLCINFQQPVCYPQCVGNVRICPRFEPRATGPAQQPCLRCKCLKNFRKNRLSTKKCALYYYCYFY